MKDEMANFNKKMEKSMEELVQSFNDGIKGVNKLQAKTAVVQALYEEKNAQNAKNIEKVNFGIANLEALTSDLKNSFSDEKSESEEKPIKKEPRMHRDKALVQTQSMNKQVLQTLSKIDPNKLKQVVSSHFLQKQNKEKASKLTSKIVNNNTNPILGEKPASLADVKTRVAETKPNQNKKTLKLTKQPVKLAQVSSSQANEQSIRENEQAKIQMFLEMQNGLKELKHTQERLHNLAHPKKKSGAVNLAQVSSLAKKLGIAIPPNGTNEQIANKMAQQVLAKVTKDTKPQNINLLQLENGSENREKIILEDKSELLVDTSIAEDIENTQTVSPSPEENELLVESMQEAVL